MTSHDVVNAVRKIMGTKKVGHSGTLDPMATGVLNVFVGQATRTIQYHSEPLKRYIGVLTLGYTSDTLDAWGRVTPWEDHGPVTYEAVLAIKEKFTGDLRQIPPMYSAVRHKGKRLYQLAREGVEVAREARRVTVASVDIRPLAEDTYELEILCSKGTYIRSLMDDMARALGTRGIMTALERMESDGYSLKEAVTLEEVVQARDRGDLSFLIPLSDLFPRCPQLLLSDEAFDHLSHGRPLDLPPMKGLTRLMYRGHLVGLGEGLDSRNRVLQRFLSEVKHGSHI